MLHIEPCRVHILPCTLFQLMLWTLSHIDKLWTLSHIDKLWTLSHIDKLRTLSHIDKLWTLRHMESVVPCNLGLAQCALHTVRCTVAIVQRTLLHLIQHSNAPCSFLLMPYTHLKHAQPVAQQ